MSYGVIFCFWGNNALTRDSHAYLGIVEYNIMVISVNQAANAIRLAEPRGISQGNITHVKLVVSPVCGADAINPEIVSLRLGRVLPPKSFIVRWRRYCQPLAMSWYPSV
jgi:hypothetical protein